MKRWLLVKKHELTVWWFFKKHEKPSWIIEAEADVENEKLNYMWHIKDVEGELNERT